MRAGYLRTYPALPGRGTLSAFESAHEHHQIVVAEREILEETLWGSVNVMAQVLGS